MPASDSVVYLDHHATTPCDPRVVDAMLPYFTEEFGNAASRTHVRGFAAGRATEHARRQVAAAIGADAREIVFTSGATEACNLAILGAARAARARGRASVHVVTVATEHRAVLDPCRALRREGVRLSELPVDREGMLAPDAVRGAIDSDTVLVSVMLANNEIGAVQPLAEVAAIARERGVLVHTDAAQALGKVPVDVRALGVDLLSLSAHKVYGPKGIGALFVRRGVALEPILHGGGQERGLRSGTLPVPLCVGFGLAAVLGTNELSGDAARIRALRDRLHRGLEERVGGVVLNGPSEPRLPGTLNVSFQGIEAQALLLSLPALAASTGSACTSSQPEPSHVLRALGLPRARALAAVRLCVGRTTQAVEIDRAIELLAGAVARLRVRR